MMKERARKPVVPDVRGEPGGATEAEFCDRLHAFCYAQRARYYRQAGTNRPYDENLDFSAVARATGLNRDKVSAILGGRRPNATELQELLAPLKDSEAMLQWLSALEAVPRDPDPGDRSSGANSTEANILYDSQADGLYVLNSWNAVRVASPSAFVFEFHQARPNQAWVDPDRLADAVRMSPDRGATVPYLIGIDVDHRKSSDNEVCRLHVAHAAFAEAAAVALLRSEQPKSLEAADAAIHANPRLYLRNAVPATINVNAIPLTASGEVICARRSGSLESAPNCWTVGVVETMKDSDVDFYELTMRALREELGVSSDEFTTPGTEGVHLLWFGLCRPVLRSHLVAVVPLKLTLDEIRHRQRSDASQSYELDLLAAHDPAALERELLGAKSSTVVTDPHAVLQSSASRRWVDHARLAATLAACW